MRPLSPRSKRDFTPIKAIIVFWTGLLIGIGSALSGIGAQVAYAPMLTWMLGFVPEKSLATALRYAVFVALGVVIGVVGSKSLPADYLLTGFLLMGCATIGAIVASPLSPKPEDLSRRQLLQTLGVGVTFFTLVQAVRIGEFIPSVAVAEWGSKGQLALLGLIVGALTQVMGLAGGTLLVPALYFLGKQTANHAVALSALVILLASLLPAWSYSRQGLTDIKYGNAASIGGFLGGVIGGLALSQLPEKPVLILFGLAAMFFCAREVARITQERNVRSLPRS